MLALKIIGIVIGSLIGIILLYLITIIFMPVLKVRSITLQGAQKKASSSEELSGVEHVEFLVDGDRIDGLLFLPDGMNEPVGCVVMSNGFGGTRGMILEQYALRFQQAGIASLLYDYRCFGTSEGQPRQYFSSTRQLEDLTAAIAYARGRTEIDEDTIVLWGTSAAGGYGLIQAAGDKKIAGVIAQCPALDRKIDGEMAVERQGMGFFLKLFIHAQRDQGRSRFGLSEHTVPIVGTEGEFAFINAKGAAEGYSALVDDTFINNVCARALIEGGDNPVDYATEVMCPVMLLICEKDNLVSPESYKKTANMLGELATVKRYPVGHFEIYQGEAFEEAVKDQIDFLGGVIC